MSRSYNILWLFFVIAAQHGQCSDPVEVGLSYTMTSTASIPYGAGIQWKLSNGNYLYDNSQRNSNEYSNLYVGSSRQLTIKFVRTLHGTVNFHHIVDSNIVYIGKFQVYKRANPVKCETLTSSGNQIRTKCITAQVFPRAKCQFTLQNGGVIRKTLSHGSSYITYTHTEPQTEVNEYYSTSCTLQYPVDGLKPGNWIVQVNMYPDLIGVSLDQGTTGHVEHKLTVPTVNVDPTSCPKGLPEEDDTNVRNGYIRQGKQASCLCTRAHEGNPPGTIGWSSTKEGNFDILSKTLDEVTLQIKSPGTFTCQSSSVLDGSHFMTYTPSFAYGPNSASLTFQKPGPIYLCPNQKTDIDIICQVPENSFNPGILFTVRGGNDSNLITKAAGDTSRSISVNYNFTQSGQNTFTCRVENAIFNDIFIESPASSIQVYAPPSSAPSFQITGQNVITDKSGTWVKPDSDISVSCLVGTAYPMVSSVTVTCGQETSSSGQLSLSGVAGDEVTCQCSVNHETNAPCNGHNLNKEIVLQIANGPSSASLISQPPGPIYLCPNQQTNVNITCQVPANSAKPHPLFIIRDVDGNTLVNETSRDATWSKSVNYNFTKSGQYAFSCRVENAFFSDMSSEAPTSAIQVYAPPNSPPSFQVSGRSVVKDSSDIWVKRGTDISVSCLVGDGYPSVSSVTVTCGQETSSSGQLSVSGVSGDELVCLCDVDHETKNPCNGHKLNKELTIYTAYGPNKVQVSLADDQLPKVQKESLNLCSSDYVEITVICVVQQSDVRPELAFGDFTLTKAEGFISQQMSLTKSEDEYRLVNTFTVSTGGIHSLVCEARNPVFSNIKQINSTTVEVTEPPRDPPEISTRSSQHGDILVEGDDVTVTCHVSGGYPPVQSVTLTCSQNQSVTSNGTSVVLNLDQIGPLQNETNCTCQATHVTECYDLMGVLPLTIVTPNVSEAVENENVITDLTSEELVGTIIGTILVIVVLAAVIALTVFYIRREIERKKNRNKNTEYDKIDRPIPVQLHYENVKPHDPNYATINPSDKASMREDTKQETEHTNRNVASGDYAEPMEPDLNVYSEIDTE